MSMKCVLIKHSIPSVQSVFVLIVKSNILSWINCKMFLLYRFFKFYCRKWANGIEAELQLIIIQSQCIII